MKILYVEDNAVNLSLIQRIAKMNQHELISYEEAEIALKILEEGTQVDLILLDIQLAGEMDGIDFAKALRARGDNRPIIAITAYAMMGDRERILEAGCNEYLPKPLPIAEFLTLLAKYDPSVYRPESTAANPSSTPTTPTPSPTSTDTEATSPENAPESAADSVPESAPESAQPASPSAVASEAPAPEQPAPQEPGASPPPPTPTDSSDASPSDASPPKDESLHEAPAPPLEKSHSLAEASTSKQEEKT